jgi:hypothetical protein
MSLDALRTGAVGRLIRLVQAPWLTVDVVDVVPNHYHVGVPVGPNFFSLVTNQLKTNPTDVGNAVVGNNAVAISAARNTHAAAIVNRVSGDHYPSVGFILRNCG